MHPSLTFPFPLVPRIARTVAAQDNLDDTLDTLLRSGSDSNPALNQLLSDYSTYHVLFVLFGSCFLVALMMFSRFCWNRYRRAPKGKDRARTFERRIYLGFTMLSAFVGLLLAVIVAANVSNVLAPREGFAGALGMIATPRAGTRTADVHQAFNSWLLSGESDMPSLIRSEIDQRLAWQQPKAVICSVLLILLIWLSVRLWRTRIDRSRTQQASSGPAGAALRLASIASVGGCLLLMLMVLGNAQASFAPLGLTLFNA